MGSGIFRLFTGNELDPDERENLLRRRLELAAESYKSAKTPVHRIAAITIYAQVRKELGELLAAVPPAEEKKAS